MSNNYFKINQNVFAGVTEFLSNKESKSPNIFLKLEAATRPYVLRICPPYSEAGLPYVITKSHSMLSLPTDRGDQTISPVCLDFLFNIEDPSLPPVLADMKQEMLTRAVEDKKLSAEDRDFWTRNGCPACDLAQRLRDHYDNKNDKDKGAMSKLWPSFRAFFNVLVVPTDDVTGKPIADRSNCQCKVFGCSQTMFSAIQDKFNIFMENDINMFDPDSGIDCYVSVTGKDAGKRYKIDFGIKPSPLGYEGSLHDLTDVFCMGIRSYSEMVTALRNTESIVSICKKYGVKL